MSREDNMKYITFAVPCYNSESYMDRCVETLLTGGNRVEIVLVDDGSSDRTAEIADRYHEKYPDIIKVVHQPNSGHGEGVNQGLRNATGKYFKVVDSDDWLDTRALRRLLDYLEYWDNRGEQVDLVVCNYIYDHLYENSCHTVKFRSAFRPGEICTWDDMGFFDPSQYMIMHALIYRTEVLRKSGLKLPKHTFYVDNIFVYQPLPAVKNMYYMDVDLYRYFIGRADQSVNEKVMVTRVDQQLRVTYHMIGSHDLRQVSAQHKKLGRYMFNYLAMMMAISSIFLTIADTPECLGKKTQLWEYLRTVDTGIYHKMKYRAVSAFTNFPGYQGRRLSVGLYRLARKIYKFN